MPSSAVGRPVISWTAAGMGPKSLFDEVADVDTEKLSICVRPVAPTEPPAPVMVTGVESCGNLYFSTTDGLKTNPEQAVSNSRLSGNLEEDWEDVDWDTLI